MRKIKTALCAYGMSGKVFHGPFLKAHKGFEVSMILERSKQLSKEDFPKATIVRYFKTIVQNDDIELVIVNTPPHLHLEMAKELLENGKHVVLEKPFTVYSKDAEELIILAKKQNLLLSVYHNRRWDSPFLTVKEIVGKQLLGDLVEFEAYFDRFRTALSGKKWKESELPGTGIVYDLGAHLIDQTLTLFGKPLSVFADYRSTRPEGTIIDNATIQLNYKNLKATLKMRVLVNGPKPQIVLNGTLGSYQNYHQDPQEALLVDGTYTSLHHIGKISTENQGKLYIGNEEEVYPSKAGNWLAFYDNIYQVLREKKQLEVTPEQALNVINIIEYCEQSNAERRVIEL